MNENQEGAPRKAAPVILWNEQTGKIYGLIRVLSIEVCFETQRRIR